MIYWNIDLKQNIYWIDWKGSSYGVTNADFLPSVNLIDWHIIFVDLVIMYNFGFTGARTCSVRCLININPWNCVRIFFGQVAKPLDFITRFELHHLRSYFHDPIWICLFRKARQANCHSFMVRSSHTGLHVRLEMHIRPIQR